MILYDYRRKLEDEPLPLAAASLFDDYCVEQRIMQAKSNVICFVPSCYFALAAQSFSSSAVEWGAQNSFPKQSGATQVSFQQK